MAAAFDGPCANSSINEGDEVAGLTWAYFASSDHPIPKPC